MSDETPPIITHSEAGAAKARATFWTRVFLVLSAVLAVVVVILQLTATLQGNQVIQTVRESQKDGISRSKDTKALAEQIRSCTTPGQPCYDRGQAQTAKAVGDINKVVVLAAACSIGLDPGLPVRAREADIQMCVITRLAREEPKKP